MAIEDQKRIAKNLYATHDENFYCWLIAVKCLKDSYAIKIKRSVGGDTNLSERANNLFEEYTIFTNEIMEFVFSRQQEIT